MTDRIIECWLNVRRKVALRIKRKQGGLVQIAKNMSLLQVTVNCRVKRVGYMHPVEAGLEYSTWRFSFPFFPYAFPSDFSSALSFDFSW